MTMIDDYLAKVRQDLHGTRDEKDAIIEELRSHLTEEVAAALERDPQSDEADVTQTVLRDFGAPEDLAFAYTPEGEGVFRHVTSGDVRLRIPEAAIKVTEAVGRGSLSVIRFAGRSIKGILLTALIAAGIVLTLGVIAGIFLFDDITALVERNIERDVYYDTVECGDAPCNGTRGPSTFHASAGMTELRYRLWGHVHDTAAGSDPGNAYIYIRDPSGRLIANLTIGDGQGDSSYATGTWRVEEGIYTVELVMVGFLGTISVDIDGVGGNLGSSTLGAFSAPGLWAQTRPYG